MLKLELLPLDPETRTGSRTGLYYYRARMYDPIGYGACPERCRGASMNLYQYCGNNLVNFVDSLGLNRYIFHDGIADGLHHWVGVDEWAQRSDGRWYKTGKIIVQSVRAKEVPHPFGWVGVTFIR